ncbi:enoyl-CoA hydratase/isomerase family protein [Spongiibacter tropicus]|uniref:enoyl-CoA hydratase/isomerase family protein n=1 Tax=Spongiibacter tropicus TaxID=454602 RepID=UPI0003B4CECE|nr:enoyl-CoA hydratase/isomerase family protein [Spongiibacter tropicus]
MVASSSADTPQVTVERNEHDVVVLTLNRPQARNAVSFDLWNDLDAAVREISQASPPRAVVLAAAGGFFCAGGDLKTPPSRGEGALAPAARLELGQQVMHRLRSLPVPVIAAVEGGAIGMGWSLALACDLIIASDEAKFSAPFLRLGLVPDGGFIWFLRKQLGVYRAAEILFSERVVTAQEALSLGLLSRLAPAGQATVQAVEMASAFGAGNRHSVEMAKRLLNTAESSELSQHSALELSFGTLSQTGEEVARVRAEAAARKQQKNA